MKGLADFVSPIAKEQFLDNYFGKKPYYSSGDSARVEGIFDWEEASKILSYSRRRMDGFRLTYKKEALPRSELKNYLTWLKKGATLVINNLDTIVPPVYDLANALEMDLNTAVNTNCYLSYPSVQGFNTHYDRHDVFIVQLDGKKKWSIFEPTNLSPTHLLEKPKSKRPKGKPDMEVELSPGDILYIPRGHWHHAVAETPSIHLTVGPGARTPIHFLNFISKRMLQNDEWFRRDFPIADAKEFGGDRSGLKEYFDEFVTRTIDRLESPAFFESFLEFVQKENGTRRPHTNLAEYWSIDKSLTPEDQFAPNPSQKSIVRYDPDNELAVVMIRGQVLNLVSVNENILELLFENTEPFCGEDIMQLGNMSWEKAKQMLIMLYQKDVCIKI